MNYCLSISNGFILGVCESEQSFENGITKEERDNIFSLMLQRPAAPEGYTYKLRADNLEWELVELPPELEYEPTEADKAEAYDILIGGTE